MLLDCVIKLSRTVYLYNYQLIDSAVYFEFPHFLCLSVFKGSMLNVSSLCNIMTNQVNTCGSHRVDGGINGETAVELCFYVLVDFITCL